MIKELSDDRVARLDRRAATAAGDRLAEDPRARAGAESTVPVMPAIAYRIFSMTPDRV